MIQHFLQRRDVLQHFWLDTFWERVPDAQMRQRPHPRVNSIAWNLWHLTRAEDATLNRFIADRSQVLDDAQANWMQRLNVPWRHQGTDMSFAEVDDLNQRIDLVALRGYSQAVMARTQDIIGQLDLLSLDELVDAERLHRALSNDGLVHSNADGMFENYRTWSKGRFLFTHGLTHAFEHVGEMGVIASLLGVNLE